MSTLAKLPSDLPIPEDDGACDHLLNAHLPDLGLVTTDNTTVNFSLLNLVVIYLYPMTGRPDVNLPEGWNKIPGARGCTPQSCSFRDHFQELQKFDAAVFGLSTQATSYQQEVRARLHLPFALVSDENLAFINALSIPTFEVEGKLLSKRLTLIAENGAINKVFYPVFPPDKNAEDVIKYLRSRKT